MANYNDILSIDDLEKAATDRMDRMTRGYFNSGADGMVTCVTFPFSWTRLLFVCSQLLFMILGPGLLLLRTKLIIYPLDFFEIFFGGW